ncbi:radical SAM/SPASM domain-containing protein [Geosporobacter ferrireducens]|uniref:Heme d1 biosynthesis radical SAM protein NirJ2 n=1 Tax=Geosporobacter ferrireducens TaxID=1424294 RepID=A0A1D8GE32_9FIRM|nr:radical SAM protein [Geosporobacter ferrireducens]AOT69167.1 heme d1 biosynthesis radical SAM protein NirJ2 [Geosporobacter ferrireducens]MTI56844.1 radical SAM protein [Geosporobacter ferrireducens]
MIISWNITKRCNLYCDHCYRDSSSDYFTGELSTKEGKKLIEEISEAGFKILVLSGGEPLMRKDVFELAHYAKQVGLKPVMGTNGTLITQDTAKQLKNSGIEAAAISIDHICEEKHDLFRNAAGCFQKALEGANNCIQAGIRVQINTTITKENKDYILDITDLARKIGATSHHPFFLVEVGRGEQISHVSLENNEYIQLINSILDKQLETDIELKPTCAPQFMAFAKHREMKMRFSRGCIAGIGYCCILPNGDVHICPYLPVKAGSVKELPFDQLWKDSTVFNSLRNFDNYKGKCGNCANLSVCGGCRARAYTKTGDYLAEDPVSNYCFMRN